MQEEGFSPIVSTATVLLHFRTARGVLEWGPGFGLVFGLGFLFCFSRKALELMYELNVTEPK